MNRSKKYDDNRREERNDTREGDFIFGFEKQRRVVWCDENQKQRSWKSVDQTEATFKIERMQISGEDGDRGRNPNHKSQF